MLDAALFYQALSTDHGIVIETPDDPEKVRQRLYVIRREIKDFAEISIVMSPQNPQEIWLVRNASARTSSPSSTPD